MVAIRRASLSFDNSYWKWGHEGRVKCTIPSHDLKTIPFDFWGQKGQGSRSNFVVSPFFLYHLLTIMVLDFEVKRWSEVGVCLNLVDICSLRLALVIYGMCINLSCDVIWYPVKVKVTFNVNGFAGDMYENCCEVSRNKEILLSY